MTARHERGVATAHMMSISVALIAVTTACLSVVMLLGMQQRARSGADFAALAASKASVEGKPACQAARRIARDNGVRIVACRLDADVATVTTKSDVRTPFGTWGVKARARAAPDFYFD